MNSGNLCLLVCFNTPVVVSTVLMYHVYYILMVGAGLFNQGEM